MKAAGKSSIDSTFGVRSQRARDSNKKSIFCILYSVFCLLSSGLYGCAADQYFQQQQLSYEKLSASYNQAKLKTNSSLDVLRVIRETESDLRPPLTETSLLSQSDTAIASTGQSKNGYKTWFTLVAFDESANGGMARRKYFYLVDEKAWLKPISLRHLQMLPKPGLIFDSQAVLPAEVLDKPYTTEEEKQIAIIKLVAESFHKDVYGLSRDNQMLSVSGMLMDQVFKAVLTELDISPSQAKNISDKSGVKFNHMSFDKGRIRTTVEGNIVTVKCMLGLFTRLFDEQD
jgi:hypothetical protein